jgi:plastocyanin
VIRTFSFSDTLRRASAPVAVAAAAALLVGGCGGAGQAAGPTNSTGSRTSTGSTSVAGVVLSVAGTEFAFAPAMLKASPGRTTIRFTNKGTTDHDFTIDALHVKLTAKPGESAEATVTLTPGTYTSYCSVPGHRQSGMQGMLMVK